MKDLAFSEILTMQRGLQNQHIDDWEQPSPGTGRNSVLWMVDEIGEVIAIIKKKGDRAIMEDRAVRAGFTEEMCDVLMYFGDIMLCYGISAEEIAAAFHKKHEYNMKRDYGRENKAMLAEPKDP